MSFFQRVLSRVRNHSKWLTCLFLLNSVLLSLLALPYTSWMDLPEDKWLPLSYIITTQIGLFGLIALICALPFFLLTWLPTKVFRILASLPFVIAIFGVVLDTQIYNQFRIHISGFMLELLLGGGGQVIKVSWFTILAGVGILLLLFVLFVGSHWLATRMTQIKSRYVALGIAVWFGSLLFSQGTHAWRYAHFDQVIPSYSHHWPLYMPLTANIFLERHGLIDQQANRDKQTRFETTSVKNLNYPLNPIQVDASRQVEAPNVVMIVIDAWRFDDANEAVTPNIAQFGKKSLNFRAHKSGGNSTQPGIFSLFYGIPSTYWDAVRSSQQKPAMMQVFKSQGYQMSIHGSAPLHTPPFDRTVFSGIDKFRIETPAPNAVERDRMITQEFMDFLDNKEDKPYFGFLFYDAAHGKNFPEDMDTPFEPYWNRIDHIKLSNSFDPTEFRNRYRNSLYYVDSLVGKVFDKLEQNGELENTVVIVTADHGEEFNDYGKNFWGHGGNFAPAQVNVPMYIYHPKLEGKVITTPTNHMDVAPTVMQEVLSVTNDISDYSVGENMFTSQRESDWIIIGSYSEYALVGENEIIMNYPGGYVEVTDLSLKKKEQREMPNSEMTRLFGQMSTYAM